MQGSLETELQGSLKLSYYMAPELHGSLSTWPSGLSSSLCTELYDPVEYELQGSLETEIQGSLAT